MGQQEYNPVTRPAHYNQYPVECIEICSRLPYEAGCAIKYFWREGQKDSAEIDRRKALQYIYWELTAPSIYVPHELMWAKLRKLCRVAGKLPDTAYSTIQDILKMLMGDRRAAARLAHQLQSEGFVEYPFAEEFEEQSGGFNEVASSF